MFAGLRAVLSKDLKIKAGQRVSDDVVMTGNVTSGDDEIAMNGQPGDATHKRHDGPTGGAPFINDVDHRFVVAEYCDSFPLPEMTPDVAGYCDGEDLMKSRGKSMLKKLGRPVAGEPLALKEPPKTCGWSCIRKN